MSALSGTTLTYEGASAALKIYVPAFSGEGTQANPYLIKTEQDMWDLSNLSYGKNYGKGLYFKLMDNIDLSAKSWQPICFSGTYGWPSGSLFYYFEGTFDGNGKTITLNIDKSGAYGMGLFGGLSGTVKNLTINGTLKVGGHSGALAGKLSDGAYIEGVTNNATINASGEHVGGLAGNALNSSVITFKNCINNGDVTSVKDHVAGMLGAGWANVTYVNCDNTGDITGTTNVGGIAGETFTSKWTTSGLDADCSNTGTITGSGDYGNLVGKEN